MARSRDAALNFKIGGSSAAFEAAMLRAEKKLVSFSDKMKNIGREMSTYVTAPIIAFGVASVGAFAKMDSLKRGLNSVTGSAAETEKEFKRLLEVAKLPGLGLEEAVRGSVNLQAAGFSADRARESLMAFGNALATVGKGRNELNLVNLALTQMQNKTTGFGQEIRQLTEQLPQLRGILQGAFGTAQSEEIAKLGYTGAEVVDILITEFGKIPKVTGGIANAFENTSDAIKLALMRVGNALNAAFDIESKANKIADIVTTLSEKFESLSPVIQRSIIAITALVAALGPLSLFIGSVLPAMVAGFQALATALSPTVLAAVAIGAAIVGLGIALKSAYDAFEGFRDLVKGVFDAIVTDIKAVYDAVSWLLAPLTAGISALMNLGGKAGNAFTSSNNGKKFADAWSDNIEAIKGQFTSLFGLMKTGSEDATKAANKAIAATTEAADTKNGPVPYLKQLELDLKAATEARDALTTGDPTVWAGFNQRIDEITQKIEYLKTVWATAIPAALPKIAGNGPAMLSTEPVSGLPQRSAEDVQRAAETATAVASQFKYVSEEAQAMNQAVNSAVSNMGVGIADAFTDMFAGLGQGGNLLANFGKSILSTIGSVATQLGKTAIAIGIGVEGIKAALKTLQPAAAIAAGIALLALGKVAQVSLSNMVPSLAIGTNMVKSDGLAQIHKGEAIVPADVVKGGFSGGRGGSIDVNMKAMNIGRELMVFLERQDSREAKLFGG